MAVKDLPRAAAEGRKWLDSSRAVGPGAAQLNGLEVVWVFQGTTEHSTKGTQSG